MKYWQKLLGVLFLGKHNVLFLALFFKRLSFYRGASFPCNAGNGFEVLLPLPRGARSPRAENPFSAYQEKRQQKGASPYTNHWSDEWMKSSAKVKKRALSPGAFLVDELKRRWQLYLMLVLPLAYLIILKRSGCKKGSPPDKDNSWIPPVSIK